LGPAVRRHCTLGAGTAPLPSATIPSALRDVPREDLARRAPRRGGRAVECGGLENRCAVSQHRGFESPPLRFRKARIVCGDPVRGAGSSQVRGQVGGKADSNKRNWTDAKTPDSRPARLPPWHGAPAVGRPARARHLGDELARLDASPSAQVRYCQADTGPASPARSKARTLMSSRSWRMLPRRSLNPSLPRHSSMTCSSGHSPTLMKWVGSSLSRNSLPHPGRIQCCSSQRAPATHQRTPARDLASRANPPMCRRPRCASSRK
jgi:hypothetical protein